MKQYFALSVALMATLFLGIAGCGGGKGSVNLPQEQPSPDGTKVTMPDGWNDPDSNAILGQGIGISSDMQTAIDKADLVAAADLAGNVERWVTSHGLLRLEDRDKFSAINGAGTTGDNVDKSYTSQREQVIDQILRGTEKIINEVYREEGQFRAYIKLRLPTGDANKALQQELQKRAELWEMYKDTQAMQQLQEAVKRYDERRKKDDSGL